MAEKGDFIFGFDTTGWMKSVKAMSASVGDFKSKVVQNMNDGAETINTRFAKMAKKTKDALNYAKTDLHYRASAFKYYKAKLFGGGEATTGQEGGAEETASAATTPIKGLTMAITKAMVFAQLLVASVKKVFDLIDRNIPEIRQAFSIAGDIFLKNLLWPLRKELLPYLQRVLDWTREHRKDFVVWGSVIVNAFKAIKHVVVEVWTALSPLIKIIKDSIASFLHLSGKSITETVNILIFKMVFLFEILMIQVKRFSKIIAESFKTGSMHELLDSLGRVVTAFSDLFKAGYNLIPIQDVVRALKDEFVIFFESFVAGIESIAAAMELLIKSGAGFRHGNKAAVGEAWDSYMKKLEGSRERISSAFDDMVHGSTSTSTSQSRINIGDIHLHVTEGNAQQAGVNFAGGLREGLQKRNHMHNEMTSEGKVH